LENHSAGICKPGFAELFLAKVTAMRKYLIPSLLGLLFFSCQKEVDVQLDQPNDVIAKENERLSAIITKQTTATWLNGQIVDEQNLPIAGASVSCAGKTAITDNKGFFYFKTSLVVNKDYALITVTKPGYMNGFRTFTPNRTKLAYHTEKIMLQLAGVPKLIPSATGGTITSDNVKLTFPAGSVIKPGGYAFNGNIKVVIRYINPNSSNFALMVPGTLSGLNNAGQINALQSFGMASVELTDQSGSKLEIAPGQTVRMEMPASATDPASIPLWHFNETYGIWVQQGVATKQGNVFVAEVNHFSIWNIDIEFNDFELTIKLQTTDSTPVANQLVKVYRANNTFIKNFYTDNAGEATLINCPSNESLTLKMDFPCDTITHTMAPVTQSRTETVTLSGPAIATYQLNGIIYKCNNQPLVNQPFQVFLTGPGGIFSVLNGISDANGQFEMGTVVASCQAPALSAQTTSYYNNQYYFSSTTNIVAGVNSYNPVLCDTTGGGGGQYNDSDVVNIPDPALQQKVRQVINKPTGTIYYIDVKNLTSLDASFLPIQTLTGLQFFTGLQQLFIHSNQAPLTNITPLATLVSLRELDLGADTAGGVLSDISPLQNLAALEELYLGGQNISNITALQNKPNLFRLDLAYNNISNLAPLQNLTGLNELDLSDNQVSNISPLAGLSGLFRLYLTNNQVSNLAAIQTMTGLNYLHLNGNLVTSVTPLQNHPALNTLDLANNQITSVVPLQDISTLLRLYLENNQVSTISSLINKLPNLTELFISQGNTVPPAEVTAFQASHPSCFVQ
jgi:Leucine-rich repeat (LRR) protein